MSRTIFSNYRLYKGIKTEAGYKRIITQIYFQTDVSINYSELEKYDNSNYLLEDFCELYGKKKIYRHGTKVYAVINPASGLYESNVIVPGTKLGLYLLSTNKIDDKKRVSIGKWQGDMYNYLGSYPGILFKLLNNMAINEEDKKKIINNIIISADERTINAALEILDLDGEQKSLLLWGNEEINKGIITPYKRNIGYVKRKGLSI
jgi:hypothetical protein